MTKRDKARLNSQLCLQTRWISLFAVAVGDACQACAPVGRPIAGMPAIIAVPPCSSLSMRHEAAGEQTQCQHVV
jgi:hypothetical protein